MAVPSGRPKTVEQEPQRITERGLVWSADFASALLLRSAGSTGSTGAGSAAPDMASECFSRRAAAKKRRLQTEPSSTIAFHSQSSGASVITAKGQHTQRIGTSALYGPCNSPTRCPAEPDRVVV